MKRKILTFLIIALAIIYLALAANFFHQYREVARVLGSYGIPPAEFNTFEEIVSLRRTFLGAGIVGSFGLTVDSILFESLLHRVPVCTENDTYACYCL